MLLEFLGAAHEVTGSCHFLQCQDKRILVDCGMEQGPDLYVNQEIPVNASNIDYVFVTHAHTDHILGAIWVIRKIQKKPKMKWVKWFWLSFALFLIISHYNLRLEYSSSVYSNQTV